MEKREKTFYEILEISEKATAVEIRKAYQALALKFHPDRGCAGAAEFQKVLQAYTILSDQETRREYDESLCSLFTLVPTSTPLLKHELTLDQIYTGTKISLHSSVINIPAGITDRTEFCLKSGERLIILTKPHPYFTRGGPLIPNTTSQDIITKILTNRKQGILEYFANQSIFWFLETKNLETKNPVEIFEKGLPLFPFSKKRGKLLIFIETVQ